MARKRTRSEPVRARPGGESAVGAALLSDLRVLIQQARSGVARAVNSAQVVLYWEIGRRVHREVLDERRAAYGAEILSTVSKELAAEFGQGFSTPNLSRMIRFTEHFPDPEIVATLSRQLSWSHFVQIIPLDDPLKRDFYAEMCRIEGWSVRVLRDKIGGMLFERTAFSKKPAELAGQELAKLREEDRLTPDLVFRDPYFLDFLGLKDTYSERDFEAAILRELEGFILELGTGFAFVARQKRMVIDQKDFSLDLLFYHRKLRRLVAIELKLGSFEAAHKGQMELYLRWLEKHEQQPGEESPIGLILCADKSEEQVELLRLDRSGIRVAGYMTELPPRPLLQKKLHEAVARARARLEGGSKEGRGEPR